MKRSVYEILKDFENAPSKAEKISVLQKNNNFELNNFLQGLFHPGIQFVFDKPIEFKRDNVPPGMGYSTIHQQLDKIYLFIENNKRVSPNLTKEKKVELATQMLESLEPKEADMLMNMFLKKSPTKGLTYAIVREAFPTLLPEKGA